MEQQQGKRKKKKKPRKQYSGERPDERNPWTCLIHQAVADSFWKERLQHRLPCWFMQGGLTPAEPQQEEGEEHPTSTHTISPHTSFSLGLSPALSHAKKSFYFFYPLYNHGTQDKAEHAFPASSCRMPSSLPACISFPRSSLTSWLYLEWSLCQHILILLFNQPCLSTLFAPKSPGLSRRQ